MTSQSRHRILLVKSVAFLTLAFAGCSGGGTVSGEVSFKGTNLAGGWVTFNYPDGKHASVSGVIRPDGKFLISGCPAGEVRVTIREARLTGRAATEKGKKTVNHKAASIPVRYADPEKTDFVATIKGGDQRLDLELKP